MLFRFLLKLSDILPRDVRNRLLEWILKKKIERVLPFTSTPEDKEFFLSLMSATLKHDAKFRQAVPKK